MVRKIDRRKVLRMSGVTVTASVGSAIVSGSAAASNCNDNSKEEAPFELINDAAEMVYCESTGAVEKVKDGLQDVNNSSDCITWQKDDSPYTVYVEEDCIGSPWNGDGCGETSYNVDYDGRKYKTQKVELSDGDTEEAARLLDDGVDIAALFASVASGNAIVAVGGFVLAQISDDWASKLRNENDGCGVVITVQRPLVYRGEPLDYNYEESGDVFAWVTNQ